MQRETDTVCRRNQAELKRRISPFPLLDSSLAKTISWIVSDYPPAYMVIDAFIKADEDFLKNRAGLQLDDVKTILTHIPTMVKGPMLSELIRWAVDTNTRGLDLAAKYKEAGGVQALYERIWVQGCTCVTLPDLPCQKN